MQLESCEVDSFQQRNPNVFTVVVSMFDLCSCERSQVRPCLLTLMLKHDILKLNCTFHLERKAKGLLVRRMMTGVPRPP